MLDFCDERQPSHRTQDIILNTIGQKCLLIFKHPNNLNRDRGYQIIRIWYTALPAF